MMLPFHQVCWLSKQITCNSANHTGVQRLLGCVATSQRVTGQIFFVIHAVKDVVDELGGRRFASASPRLQDGTLKTLQMSRSTTKYFSAQNLILKITTDTISVRCLGNIVLRAGKKSRSSDDLET